MWHLMVELLIFPSNIIFVLCSFGKSISSHLTFINISESWLNLGRVMCTVCWNLYSLCVHSNYIAKGIMERVLVCYYTCVINTSCIPVRLLQGRELNCVHKVPHTMRFPVFPERNTVYFL